MDIADFIGTYPPLSYDKYLEIYQKKEFNQLQPVVAQPDPNVFKYTENQTYVQRLLSLYTIYDRLLLFWEVGTGKTAAATALCEHLLYEYDTPYRIAHVFVRNNALVDNFRDKLVKKFTNGKYIPKDDDYNSWSAKKKVININKILEPHYSFQTFGSFSNRFYRDSKSNFFISDERIHQLYDNSVIIIDEGHNLKSEERIYLAFHKLLHTAKNLKILIMTGTPNQDLPYEHAKLLNLLLPLDRQMKCKPSEFKAEYLSKGLIKSSVEDKLMAYYEGIISVIRAPRSLVKRVFRQSDGTTTAEVNLYRTKMSKLQNDAYIQADKAPKKPSADEKDLELDEEVKIEKDIKKMSDFYKPVIEASNFVFPDGSYGQVGFKKYMAGRDNKMPSMKPIFRDEFKGASTNEDKLKILEKFSAKYAATIRDILSTNGNVYVYNSTVHGGGCLVFARLLELFGFDQYTGGDIPADGRLRYAVLTNVTIKDVKISKLVSDFNAKDNAQGKRIKVIISSRIGNEGLDFFNIQKIHIHTLFWNFGVIDQAMGRSFRYGSHEEIQKIFKKNGQEFQVEIFFHEAKPRDQGVVSIDNYLYTTSLEKDQVNKQFERLMFTAAVDCQNNLQVNQLNENFNNSRECHYLPCDYECRGFEEAKQKNLKIKEDHGYKLYFSGQEQEFIYKELLELFNHNPDWTLNALEEHFSQNHGEISKFSIMCVLRDLIDKQLPFKNRFGFNCFLKADGDHFYLTSSMKPSQTHFESWYVMLPPVIPQQESSAATLRMEANMILMNEIAEKKKIDVDIVAFLDPIYQEPILEELVNKFLLKEPLSRNQEILMKYFEKNLREIAIVNDTLIISSLAKPPRYRTLANPLWKDCDKDILQLMEEKKDEFELERNPVGYYGIVNKADWAAKGSKIVGFHINECAKGDEKMFIINNNKGEEFKAKTLDELLGIVIGKYPNILPNIQRLVNGKPGSTAKVKKPDMVWTLVDKPDKRKASKGQVCGSGIYTVPELIRLCYQFSNVNNKEFKKLEIDTSDIDVEIEDLDLRKEIRQMQPKLLLDLSKIPDSDLPKIYALAKLHRYELCVMLKDWFELNRLVKFVSE